MMSPFWSLVVSFWYCSFHVTTCTAPVWVVINEISDYAQIHKHSKRIEEGRQCNARDFSNYLNYVHLHKYSLFWSSDQCWFIACMYTFIKCMAGASSWHYTSHLFLSFMQELPIIRGQYHFPLTLLKPGLKVWDHYLQLFVFIIYQKIINYPSTSQQERLSRHTI